MINWNPEYNEEEAAYFCYILSAWNGQDRQVLERCHTRHDAVEAREGFKQTRPEFSDYRITKA